MNTEREEIILRHIGLGQILVQSTVLGLQRAYDRVPRDILIRAVTKRFQGNRAGIISRVLKKMCIFTSGDVMETKRNISRGVF